MIGRKRGSGKCNTLYNNSYSLSANASQQNKSQLLSEEAADVHSLSDCKETERRDALQASSSSFSSGVSQSSSASCGRSVFYDCSSSLSSNQDNETDRRSECPPCLPTATPATDFSCATNGALFDAVFASARSDSHPVFSPTNSLSASNKTDTLKSALQSFDKVLYDAARSREWKLCDSEAREYATNSITSDQFEHEGASDETDMKMRPESLECNNKSAGPMFRRCVSTSALHVNSQTLGAAEEMPRLLLPVLDAVAVAQGHHLTMGTAQSHSSSSERDCHSASSPTPPPLPCSSPPPLETVEDANQMRASNERVDVLPDEKHASPPPAIPSDECEALQCAQGTYSRAEDPACDVSFTRSQPGLSSSTRSERVINQATTQTESADNDSVAGSALHRSDESGYESDGLHKSDVQSASDDQPPNVCCASATVAVRGEQVAMSCGNNSERVVGLQQSSSSSARSGLYEKRDALSSHNSNKLSALLLHKFRNSAAGNNSVSKGSAFNKSSTELNTSGWLELGADDGAQKRIKSCSACDLHESLKREEATTRTAFATASDSARLDNDEQTPSASHANCCDQKLGESARPSTVVSCTQAEEGASHAKASYPAPPTTRTLMGQFKDGFKAWTLDRKLIKGRLKKLAGRSNSGGSVEQVGHDATDSADRVSLSSLSSSNSASSCNLVNGKKRTLPNSMKAPNLEVSPIAESEEPSKCELPRIVSASTNEGDVPPNSLLWRKSLVMPNDQNVTISSGALPTNDESAAGDATVVISVTLAKDERGELGIYVTGKVDHEGAMGYIVADFELNGPADRYVIT